MLCPKCGFNATDPENCPQCGVNFSGYKSFLEHHQVLATVGILQGLSFLKDASTLFVKQQEDALRIVTGWQSLNHYAIMDSDGRTLALLAERDQGFSSMIFRHFMRNRRSLIIDIFDGAGQVIAQLNRPFFWFFSSLYVTGPGEIPNYGAVERRFSFWLPRYDLCTPGGEPFGSLSCPFFGGATLGGSVMGNRNYDVYDRVGRKTGSSIMRVWNGLMRVFSDEDTYCVQLTSEWTAEQKLVILAAAVSIDFDSYEGDSSLIQDGANIAGMGGLGGLLGGSGNDND